MGINASHLHPKLHEYLELPLEDRLARLDRPIWIDYARARTALKMMERLRNHPTTHRMPNMMIYGPTNNGKTTIVAQFLRQHPPDENIDGDASRIPVLKINMPHSASPRTFFARILEKLNAVWRATASTDALMTNSYRLLRGCSTRVLIIDEMHNILASNVKVRREFLNLLRDLGNELQISIVGLGLESAMRAIEIDVQLANRFEAFPLPRWKDGSELRGFLKNLEKTTPLRRPSNLTEDRQAGVILDMSEGILGEMIMLVRRAAAFSIENGLEHVDPEIFQECGYVIPSARRS